MKFVGGLPGLRARYGIRWTRQHINRLERSGEFPKKVELGRNTKDWVEEEIDKWLAGKLQARDDAAE